MTINKRREQCVETRETIGLIQLLANRSKQLQESRGEGEVEEEGREQLEGRGGKAKANESTHLSFLF